MTDSKRVRRGRMHAANWVGLFLILAGVFGVAYAIAAGQTRVEVPGGHQGVLFKKALFSFLFNPDVKTAGPGIYEIESGKSAYVLPDKGMKAIDFVVTLDGDWKSKLPFVSGRQPQVVSGSFSVPLEKFPLEALIKQQGGPEIELLWAPKLVKALHKHGGKSENLDSFASESRSTFSTVMKDEFGVSVESFRVDSIHGLEGEKVDRLSPMVDKLPILDHVPVGIVLRYSGYAFLGILGVVFLLYLLSGAAAGFGEALVAFTGLPVAPFAGFSNACFGTDIDFWDFGEALGAVAEAAGQIDFPDFD